jgi:hypothetical protein
LGATEDQDPPNWVQPQLTVRSELVRSSPVPVFLQSIWTGPANSSPCCDEQKTKNHITYKESPQILVLEYPGFDIHTSHTIEFIDDNDVSATLKLRGIIYHGHHHFTSRIISNEKHVWFHDGVTTKHLCTYDGLLDEMNNDDLKNYDDTNLVIAIYAQDM